MRLSSLVGHCREVLENILRRPNVPADALIAPFFRERRYLGSRDRGFIAETVYGTLREFLRYRFFLFGLHDANDLDPEREAAGTLVAFLLERGEEDRDAVAQGAGLSAGAVERIAQLIAQGKERITTLSEPERSGTEFALPTWLAEELLGQYGDTAPALMRSLKEPAPVTIRTNRLLTTQEQLTAALRKHGIDSVPGRYAPDALLLQKRLNANALPEFKQGNFELQDEGSQMLSVLLDPHPNWKVFDACAGAGGKSLHLATLMKGRGTLVAHDSNERRLLQLRPRLRRSGAQNVRLLKPSDYYNSLDELIGSFDAVMIDAPCTGTGTLRRNPGMVLTLERETLDRVAKLQQEILNEYSGLVKLGGVLFYATCSLLRQENEEQIERFLEGRSGWSLEPLSPPDGMGTEEGFFRALPQTHGMDGFFGAMLRRGKDGVVEG